MTPAQAKQNLAQMAKQLQAHVDSCKPHETVISRDLLLWFIAGANKGGSLDTALGLKRSRGRPEGSAYFKKLCKAFALKMAGKKWNDIAVEVEWPRAPRELERACSKESSRIAQHYAALISDI